MLWADFIGGTYQALSPVIASDQAVNVFVETRDVPGSPKQATLYGTPGLDREATVATTGCRGWYTLDGQTWVVVGDRLYEREAAGTYTDRGRIPNDGNPVSFASNGQGGDQLGICGGGEINVLELSTNTLTTAALPFSNPVTMAFLDGYALANQADSLVVWFSALEDMTTWDALDFYTRSGTPDNVVAIGVSRDRVWTFGSQTTTLYYNSGDADTPFVPYPGTTFQAGLASPWLLGLYSDTWMWVAESVRGGRQFVIATEPSAKVVSTPPIEQFFASSSSLENGRLLVYEQEGHTFAIVTLPDSTHEIKAKAYDLREQLWHGRADWDHTLGEWAVWRCAGVTTVDGVVLVGDRTTGKLYELDLETYDNDGDILRRERTAPYLSAENQWFYVDQFQLGTQPGVGLSSGQGSEPLVSLEISRDGARTWTSAGTAPLGALGQYQTRTKWTRLGRFIAGMAAFRVTMTDPVKCVWGPGAWLRIQSGTGQL